MRGTVSFHPVDLGFFDGLIQPLLLGSRVNPGAFLEAALRLRESAWVASRYAAALGRQLEGLEPPPLPDGAGLWDRVRSRLERFDHRPDPASLLAGRHVDVELHLRGRPFFITEGSAERVAALVDEFRGAADADAAHALALEQLVHLSPALAQRVRVEPEPLPATSPPFRTQLLDGLKEIYDLAGAAREGTVWRGSRARETVARELPWRAICLHARAVPFWLGHEVDGLATVCRAAGVEPPDVLVPAWRLFGDAGDSFDGLRETLNLELGQERDLGSFVAPADVGRLLAFLNTEGSRIIQAAARHDEGPACATLLRKIRECARYAERHRMGYVEAAGVPALYPEVAAEPVGAL